MDSTLFSSIIFAVVVVIVPTLFAAYVNGPRNSKRGNKASSC